MRLRQVPVEHKVCSVCREYYEGGSRMCDHEGDPDKDRRVARDLLVLVGTDPPTYLREERCKCSECGNLIELPRCPSCNGASARQLTHVWVRTFFAVADDLVQDTAALNTDGDGRKGEDDGRNTA